MAEFLARIRKPRFSRGEVLGAAVLLAVACPWPVLLGLAVAPILFATLHRASLTVAESIAIVAILGVLIALGLPSVTPDHTVRNRSRRAVPPPAPASSSRVSCLASAPGLGRIA